jgi:hypothetical protein
LVDHPGSPEDQALQVKMRQEPPSLPAGSVECPSCGRPARIPARTTAATARLGLNKPIEPKAAQVSKTVIRR